MKKWISFLPFTVFAQDAAQSPQGGLTQTLIMIGIALLFFYFILWRPEQKRRQAAESMRSQLKKGDKVTAMGIIGTIDKIDENTVVLKMIDGTKIEMLKGAITDIQSSGESSSKNS